MLVCNKNRRDRSGRQAGCSTERPGGPIRLVARPVSPQLTAAHPRAPRLAATPPAREERYAPSTPVGRQLSGYGLGETIAVAGCLRQARISRMIWPNGYNAATLPAPEHEPPGASTWPTAGLQRLGRATRLLISGHPGDRHAIPMGPKPPGSLRRPTAGGFSQARTTSPSRNASMDSPPRLPGRGRRPSILSPRTVIPRSISPPLSAASADSNTSTIRCRNRRRVPAARLW